MEIKAEEATRQRRWYTEGRDHHFCFELIMCLAFPALVRISIKTTTVITTVSKQQLLPEILF